MIEAMSLHEAIFTTRAIRRFSQEPIPAGILRQVLEAATQAPSGRNSQPWHFVVVQESEQKEILGTLYKEAFFENRPSEINEPDSNSSVYLARNLGKAAAIIAVCAPNSNPSGLGAIRTFASIFPAIQNMLLTARSLGLGGNITINHILRHEEIKESLKIPADKQIIALIPMGYPGAPEKHGPKRRKSVIEVSWSENWGAPLAFE